MKPRSFTDMRCPVAGALEVVGDRWTLLLIRDLSLGLSRYDAFRASTGIPAATLASRLRHLTDHGIVERVRYQERPARDAYRLTAKGRDLWKVSMALREWGDRWDVAGIGAPTVEAIDSETGRPLRLALVDDESGIAVPKERVRLRAGPGADAAVRALIDEIPDGNGQISAPNHPRQRETAG
jgi:DNA-binding HxlR family transcriptional regulator